MTILTSKFNLVTKDSLPLAMSGIWDTLVPSEIALAKAAGSGAGVPDATGTVALGTLASGTVMELNSSFNLVLANSQDLTANHRKMFWVVFEGDDEFSGAQAGAISVVHGGMRMETTVFSVGPVYTPGAPLIVTAGVLTPKVAANDNIQAVGYVASGVSQDGILDCWLPQGLI